MKYHKTIPMMLAAVLFGTVLRADSTKLEITGSKKAPVDSTVKVKVDELVTLKINSEPGVQIVIFVVPEMAYSRNRAGSEISFYAKAGRHTFCFAAFVAGKQPSKATYIVDAGNVPPDPNPPGPGPDPNPKPPGGFAGKVYAAAMKVQSPDRAGDAKTLAKVLRTVASKAAAVSTMNLNQMKMELANGFKSTLSDAQKARWSSWSQELANLLKPVATTKAAAIKAFNDAATGLEAVR